ncbi:MAG: sugar phosphate isomerase/epimerase [Hyphomicrobiales bacterium]|nr:sugar phosphate isomerase/epimerase [Hyphomicrobiales bacterium]
MSVAGLSINLATIRAQWDLRQAADACQRLGITAVAPWRDQVERTGLAEAVRIVRDNGLSVTDLCRGGMFPAPDAALRQRQIDDNRRAVDEAAALGAHCLVLVCGGLPEGSRDLAAARAMVRDGIAALLPHARACKMPLAIEPLHPMYAADRACVNTLEQALDLCDALGDGVGVAIDTYHVWWDPKLFEQIVRAGRGRRILAHHICDWLVPTRHLLLDRGMMGDGVIEFRPIRRTIEAAGFTGAQAVEILSESWWKRPGEEVLTTAIERYRTHCTLGT